MWLHYVRTTRRRLRHALEQLILAGHQHAQVLRHEITQGDEELLQFEHELLTLAITKGSLCKRFFLPFVTFGLFHAI